MIQSVIKGVSWIPGRDRFLPDSHVYVIGDPEGEDFTLVECGLMDMAAYKLQELESSGIKTEHVKRIILTHTHIDHVGCLPEFLKAIPHAEVWVHKNEADPLEAGEDGIVFGSPMFESMIRSQYNISKGFFKINVHRKLEGGEILQLGGMEFKVMHLPGHSAGSIGLFNEQFKMFMSGDTIYADGAIGRYDLVSADAGQLKQSLAKISKLGIDILLPCHNRIVKGGAQNMIADTVRQWSPLLV